MPRNKSERVPDWLAEYREAASAMLASVEACDVCSDRGLKMSCYNHTHDYRRWVMATYKARTMTGGDGPNWQGSFSETVAAIEAYIKDYRAPQPK